MPTEDAPKKRTRLSFSRKHTQEGVVAELLVLLEATTSDGRISEAEARELAEWLHENGSDSQIPGIVHLSETVRAILADGRVTPEECEDLYRAVETILPVEARRYAKSRRTEADRVERELLRPIYEANFMVAGVLYEGRGKVVDRFAAARQSVFLIREPNNPFDPNAVRIRLPTGHDIGYAPRIHAAILAKPLDSGSPYRASITKILQGRKAPIPVVDAKVYRPDAGIESLPVPTKAPIQPAAESLASTPKYGAPATRTAPRDASDDTVTATTASNHGCLVGCLLLAFGFVLLVALARWRH